MKKELNFKKAGGSYAFMLFNDLALLDDLPHILHIPYSCYTHCDQ